MRRSPLVLGVLALLIAATAGGSAWWVIREARRAMIDEVRRTESLAADERATALAQSLAVFTERTRVTARNPAMVRTLRAGNVELVQAALSFYLTVPGVTAIAVTDLDGRTIAASGRTLSGPPRETLTYRSDRTRTATFVSLAVPVLDDAGTHTAWLRTEVSLTKINPQLRQRFRDFEGMTSLVTRSGVVLLTNSRSTSHRITSPPLVAAVAAGRPGTASYHSPMGDTDRMAAVAPVAGTDLMVIVSTKASVATMPAGSLAARLGLTFVVTLTIVGVLGGLGSLVLRRSRQELEEARRATAELARTDPLTGVANRRAFDTTLAELTSEGRSAALVLIDLDHLKAINDTSGHGAGDLALRMTAEAIRSVVRPSDLVARIGGDEFVVVLPETSEWRAVAVATDVRAAIAGIELPRFGALSASTGVAVGSGDLTAAMEHADRSLYDSKRSRQR